MLLEVGCEREMELVVFFEGEGEGELGCCFWADWRQGDLEEVNVIGVFEAFEEGLAEDLDEDIGPKPFVPKGGSVFDEVGEVMIGKEEEEAGVRLSGEGIIVRDLADCTVDVVIFRIGVLGVPATLWTWIGRNPSTPSSRPAGHFNR